MPFYFEGKYKLKLDGLATISLSLSHYIAVFASSFSLLEMVTKTFPQVYGCIVCKVTNIWKQIIDKNIQMDWS